MSDEIIVATTNENKLREIKQVLKGSKVQGIGISVKEDGKTFEENALKKACSIKLKPGQIAIADDSGLMVDVLDEKPGIRSARFASPPTAENLCRKLLYVMRNVNSVMRRAKFICVIAVVFPNGKSEVVKGVVCGRIISEMRGKNGFGYDPVFVPNGYKKTFAEMSPSFKNRISHRGKALKKLSAKLQRLSVNRQK